jgi:hypothetical protein
MSNPSENSRKPGINRRQVLQSATAFVAAAAFLGVVRRRTKIVCQTAIV